MKKLREFVQEWWSKQSLLNVKLIENFDKSDQLDYVIDYESRFIPNNENLIQVSIYSTLEGMIGVEVEPRNRIASRLGAVVAEDSRVCGGWEPGIFYPEFSGLYGRGKDVLDLASTGRLAVIARVGSAGLVKQCKVVVLPRSGTEISLLETGKAVRFETEKEILVRYREWS